MTSHGTTKEQIVKLISNGTNTLSTISVELNLAPSTVSKHIHDLESSGVIEQKENEHVKKWKYYQLASGAEQVAQRREHGMILNKSTLRSAAAIAVFLVIVSALYLYTLNPSGISGIGSTTVTQLSAASPQSNAYVPISITDPPQVPNGTQALYINYSSIGVLSVYHGNSIWTTANSSGELNLMTLINESQVIGGVNVTANSLITKITFYLTSANIVVDNVTYPVQLTSNFVTAQVENNGTVNDSSGILLDFSPVVTSIYTQSNASAYVLLPSLRAVITPNQPAGRHPEPAGPGPTLYPVQQQYKTMFSRPDPSTSANLILTNTQLSSSNNSTSFQVTLTNNGGSNITVSGIIISDNQIMPPMRPYDGPTVNYTFNVSGYGNYTVHTNTQKTSHQHKLSISGGQWGASVKGAQASDLGASLGVPGVSSAGVQISTPPAGPGISGSGNPGASINGVQIPNGRIYQQYNSDIAINASALYATGVHYGYNSIQIRLPRPISNISIYGNYGNGTGEGFGINGHGSVNGSFTPPSPPAIPYQFLGISFIVARNGTLVLPMPTQIGIRNQGYTLAPGSSVTLSFDGKIVTGGGQPLSLNQSTYRVSVITDRGIVLTNVTTT